MHSLKAQQFRAIGLATVFSDIFARKMASDKLTQLLKQRALLEEHLAWLESEINALQSESIEMPATISPYENAIPANRLAESQTFENSPEPTESPLIPSELGEPEQKSVLTDIYDELGPETRDSVNDARKGCILGFIGAFAILGAIVSWILWKY